MRKVRTSALQKRASFIELALAVAILGPTSAFAQTEAPPTPSPKTQPPVDAKKEGPKSPATPTAPDTAAAPGEAPPDSEETPPAAEGGTDSAAPTDDSAEAAPEGETSTDETASDEMSEYPDGQTGMTPMGGSASGGLTAEGQSGADFGAFPNPAEDQKALEKQGAERPKDIETERVFAEDWWSHTRPTLELHGNFRVRASLYHNFSLNRLDSPGAALWPRPADDAYSVQGRDYGAYACTADETKSGSNDSPGSADQGCVSRTQGGADMRFRLEPDIVISDNLRIRSQIDLLGNLVMGSTAQGNTNFPAATGGGYTVGARSGYSPVSAQTSSADSPVSGVNSLQDAITVRRAWAEYETPVGELKFGRMPDHWGLGILRNAGDDIDGDYQSTVDRIAFFTGLPSLSLYAGGAWDFMNEGATSAAFTPPGGQAYDLSQRDDLSRMNLMLFRKMDAQLEELALKKGKIVLNGGLYLTYQWQRLASDYSAPCSDAPDTEAGAAIDCTAEEATTTFVRRGFKMWTPDLYAEIKYKKFYAGLEVVTHQGKYDSLAVLPGDSDYENPGDGDDGWKIRQWAIAGEIEQRLVEDRLLLGFYSGWASGDADVDSLVPPDGLTDADTQLGGDRTISTFRFHPGYRVDLILNRHLLSRVQGSYYIKPMAQYDFIRKTNGMKVGGRAEAIWTRASTPMQTPGHHRDLGIELNGTVYYQSSDGSLNDRQDLKGGFYSMAQYGVLFPLSGLGYQDAQTPADFGVPELKLKAAQLVRVFLGVAF